MITDQIATARSQRSQRRRRPRKETPNLIDRQVGARLQLRRKMLGLSQEKLGEMIGVTAQQIQKYESGASGIAGSRLDELSRFLDVPVSFFFDDADPVYAPAIGGFAALLMESFEDDPLHRQEMLELVRAYFSIKDAIVRRSLLNLVKAFATESHAAAETSSVQTAPASQ